MIKYNPKKWFSLIFQFHRSDTFRILLPSMLLIGLYTAAFTYIELEVLGWKDGGTTAVHSLLGIVLGLVLVFRTNSAYDRWWEGRKLWGALINETRNMAMKIQAFLPEDDVHNRQFFSRYITNYVYAMKGHLRGKVNLNELELMEELSLHTLEKAKHIPNIIATTIYTKCNQLYRRQLISGDQFIILDKEVKALTDIVGACERIKNTPIPYSYSLFMKKFIFIYTMTMPLGFITSFEYWTIPVVMFVFYVLVSIELIAEEIEEPFGIDSNDLPMEEMALRIKQNVREIISTSHKSLVTGHS
jgi:ion channel-forming bestrophin family protein